MLVKEIMTPNVEVVSPGDTLEQAARKMEELDVGPLPVCEGIRVVGQGLRIDFALEVLILYYLPSCARLRVVVGMLRGLA